MPSLNSLRRLVASGLCLALIALVGCAPAPAPAPAKGGAGTGSAKPVESGDAAGDSTEKGTGKEAGADAEEKVISDEPMTDENAEGAADDQSGSTTGATESSEN